MSSLLVRIRITRKSFLLISVGILYILAGLIGKLLIASLNRRRRFFSRLVQIATRIACWTLCVKVRLINPPKANERFFFVGNHLGFLDILALSSNVRTLFITSVEMKNAPVLGLLCEIGGCLFVDRRNRMKIKGELVQIKEALIDGFSVVLYPEGTSGDGRKILPLKKSFLVASAGTEVLLCPMVINYRRVNGEPMRAEWRNSVFWYGNLSFIQSIAGLMKFNLVEAEIEFKEPILVSEITDRHELGARLQNILEASFVPIK